MFGGVLCTVVGVLVGAAALAMQLLSFRPWLFQLCAASALVLVNIASKVTLVADACQTDFDNFSVYGIVARLHDLWPFLLPYVGLMGLRLVPSAIVMLCNIGVSVAVHIGILVAAGTDEAKA